MVRGVSPEVHRHLHHLERVQLQVVLTTPEDQLFHLLSVSGLITVLDQTDDGGVVKLQEFDRGVP